MTEWNDYTLNDLILDKKANLQTGPFGTMLNASEYAENGVPVIAVQDIGDNRLIHDKFVFVNQKVAERLSKYKVKENDIIFGRKGATDRRAIINKNEEGWLQGSDCIRLRLSGPINAKFVSYQLATKKDWMLQFSTGATMPSLNQEILKLLPIKLPSNQYQNIVTEILSSLDDKIDLLHRQNKTLEQLAETIFRQWFVEEAEENWEVVRICDVAKINFKSLSSNYPFSEIEYLDTGSITQGKISGFQTYKFYEAPSRAQRIVFDNDIVYSLVRPIQRHYGLLYGIKPNTIASTGFCVITCLDFSPHFLYILLTRNENVEFLDMVAEGATSTYPSLKPSDIANFEFSKPPKEKLENFSNYAINAWRKINSNTDQIRTLTQMRDTLLPKLMSGEVNVN